MGRTLCTWTWEMLMEKGLRMEFCCSTVMGWMCFTEGIRWRTSWLEVFWICISSRVLLLWLLLISIRLWLAGQQPCPTGLSVMFLFNTLCWVWINVIFLQKVLPNFRNINFLGVQKNQYIYIYIVNRRFIQVIYTWWSTSSVMSINLHYWMSNTWDSLL